MTMTRNGICALAVILTPNAFAAGIVALLPHPKPFLPSAAPSDARLKDEKASSVQGEDRDLSAQAVVAERQRRGLCSSEPGAVEHRQDRSVTGSLGWLRIRSAAGEQGPDFLLAQRAACEQRPELADAADAYTRRRLPDVAAGQLSITVHHSDLLAVPR